MSIIRKAIFFVYRVAISEPPQLALPTQTVTQMQKVPHGNNGIFVVKEYFSYGGKRQKPLYPNG